MLFRTVLQINVIFSLLIITCILVMAQEPDDKLHLFEMFLNHKIYPQQNKNILRNKPDELKTTQYNPLHGYDDSVTKTTIHDGYHYYADMGRNQTKVKVIDMMQQVMYQTQARMQYMDRITKPHIYNTCYKMAIIFRKLQALLTDLKKVYKSMTMYNKVGVPNHNFVIFYEHALRLYIDIVYIVEWIIYLHGWHVKYGTKHNSMGATSKSTHGVGIIEEEMKDFTNY